MTRRGREPRPNAILRLAPRALILLAFCTCLSPVAAAEMKTIKLYHVHTGEKLEITFKRDGQYDKAALRKINLFLRDWRRNQPTKMDPRLLELLWAVYRETKVTEYIHVLGGFRAPETNSMLRSRSPASGVAEHSQHILGKALDFFIPGVPLAELRAAGLKMQMGGVGYYPRSGSPFVHLDVGNARMWPRMSRQELSSLFRDGKTLYIPADGRPLPGYEDALASYRKRVISGQPALDIRPESSPTGFLASLFRKRTLPDKSSGVQHEVAEASERGDSRLSPLLPAQLPHRSTSDTTPTNRLALEDLPASAGDDQIKVTSNINAYAHIPVPALRPAGSTSDESQPDQGSLAVDTLRMAVKIPLPRARPDQDTIAIALPATRPISLEPNDISAETSRLRSVRKSGRHLSQELPTRERMTTLVASAAGWDLTIDRAGEPANRLASTYARLSAKPDLVLAEGFVPSDTPVELNRFSGPAVVFLPIRRFRGN